MITDISQGWILLQKDFIWRSNERITGSPAGQSHRWRCCPNHISKDHEAIFNSEISKAIFHMSFEEKRTTKTPKSAYALSKAAFQKQKHAPIMVSMTTYSEADILDMDQWHTAHAWCIWHILPPTMGTTESHMRTDDEDDARSARSHRWALSRWDDNAMRLTLCIFGCLGQ